MRSRTPAARRAETLAWEKPARATDLLLSVAFPKGGGAIRRMGEKLSVDAATAPDDGRNVACLECRRRIA